MTYPLSQLQETLDSIDTRITMLEGDDPTNPTLEGRVGGLESDVAGLRLAGVDHVDRLDALEDRAGGLERSMTDAAQMMVSHSDRLAEYGSRLGGLDATTLQTVARFTQAENRISALENRPAAGSTAWPGHVILGDIPGDNPTDEMRKALAAIAADPPGRRRVLILPPGTTLVPGSVPFAGFSGMSIIGGVVPQDEFSQNCRVTIAGAAPKGVFAFPPGQTKSVTFANIGWEGPGSSQVCRFLPDNFTDQLAYSVLHGNSFDNFTSVFRRRLLGVIWSGSGYINNSTETPVEVTGSDYKLFTDGLFLDSPHLADNEYLLHIKSGNKVTIGPVFVTGDGPTPVRVSAGQMIRLNGLEMEAEGNPRKTAGAGLFVSGGNVIVDNAWFFRTMANPTATGRGDNGVIHVEGAGTCVRVKNATFGEYNTDPLSVGGPLNVPERPGGYTENHVYAGGSSRVYLDAALPWNMQANAGTGGTTGARPLKVAKAGTAQIFTTPYTAL